MRLESIRIKQSSVVDNSYPMDYGVLPEDMMLEKANEKRLDQI